MDKIAKGTGYAWAIQADSGKWLVCNWAEPTKKNLLSMGKPSPEARIVPVKIVKFNPRKDGGE